MRKNHRLWLLILCFIILLDIWAVFVYVSGGEAVQASYEEESVPMEHKGYIALTFDDGPHPRSTRKLLDGLKERGIQATFFLMGSNIEGNEELVEEMKLAGHLIGNHGYSHIQMTKAGAEATFQSIEKTGHIIEEITGEKPEYWRPPYGEWNGELEDAVRMTTVLWTLDSLDWKYRSAAPVVRRVLKEAEDGDIILMHDIFDTSVEAALEIVDTLVQQGYTFVTVDELTID